MATEYVLSEFADGASSRDIEDDDPIRQVRAITPSSDTSEEYEHISVKKSKKSSSQIADAKVTKAKALSKWALVRNMF